MPTRTAAWRAIGLLAVVCTGVGVGVGLMLTSSPAPENLTAPSESGSVEVVARDFADPRVVQVTPELETPPVATSAASGTLRYYRCRPGESLQSGTPVLVVDDHSVIALHMSSPPWRDLAIGTQGDDVLALQAELARLGYDIVQDGHFGRQVETAVNDLWRSAGAGDKVRSLALDRIMWIPEPEVIPTTCPLVVGQWVAPGDTILTAGGGLTGLTVQLPEGITPGTRTVSVGDVSAALPADLVVRDPALLDAFATAHPGDLAEATSGSSASLTVESQLAEPIPVVAVPPSALYDVAGTQACLRVPNDRLAVSIIASQLGEVMVTAPQLPTRVSLGTGNGDGDRPCR